MKSKRAKSYLDDIVIGMPERTGKEYFVTVEEAREAVEFAEQDAEKRLLNIFKKELYEDGLMKNSSWIAERIFQRVIAELNKG